MSLAATDSCIIPRSLRDVHNMAPFGADLFLRSPVSPNVGRVLVKFNVNIVPRNIILSLYILI